MTRAYIGLGANLADPAGQVREAIARIGRLPQTALIAQSSLYRSAPLGPAGQADYCNAACAVDTALSAEALLAALHAIERDMGRERPPVRWAPRLIDLDLLLYGDVACAGPGLTLPHPEMHRRNFVMAPLAEIAPEASVPGIGAARAIAARLGASGLAKWELV